MIIMEWRDVHPEPHGSIRFSVPDLEKVSQMIDRVDRILILIIISLCIVFK